MTTSRRQFLASALPVTAVGAAALAVASTQVGAAAVVATLMRKPVDKLPSVQTGDVMSAQSWNDLVNAVNDLRENR